MRRAARQETEGGSEVFTRKWSKAWKPKRGNREVLDRSRKHTENRAPFLAAAVLMNL